MDAASLPLLLERFGVDALMEVGVGYCWRRNSFFTVNMEEEKKPMNERGRGKASVSSTLERTVYF